MANRMRGEVALVGGGRRLRLCLTMSALAEIEGLVKGRGEMLSGAEAVAMLKALLRGGGEADAAETVETLGIDARTAMRAVAAALMLAGGA